MASITIHHVVASIPIKGVVTGTTINGVIALACVDDVIASVAINGVVQPVSAVDLIALRIGIADAHAVAACRAVYGAGGNIRQDIVEAHINEPDAACIIDASYCKRC